MTIDLIHQPLQNRLTPNHPLLPPKCVISAKAHNASATLPGHTLSPLTPAGAAGPPAHFPQKVWQLQQLTEAQADGILAAFGVQVPPGGTLAGKRCMLAECIGVRSDVIGNN